jgi:hypothetical protein
MKLSKTLWCVSFIVTAVFSMPVLALTPLGQIDSFDDIAATGWTEPTGTELMEQDSNTFHEGSGSIRVKFEDRGPAEWDVDIERVIALNLDYNEPNKVALTFWVDHNATGDECVRELKVFEGDNVLRFVIPQMSAGWHKVVAPTNLFTVVAGSSFNWAAVDKIQFFCSTWDNPGGSVWIDDLRLELVTPQMKLYQIDSMDDVIDPCDPNDDHNDNFWHDGRQTGYMKQEVTEVNEGTGSMKIDFTMYPSGLEDGYDIEPVRDFQTDLDFTHYEDLAITIWVWQDVESLNLDSRLWEIILYDNNDLEGHDGRFRVSNSAVVGWHKVVAPLGSVAWDKGEPNWAAIGKIGLWASTYEDNGNEIYLDDFCVEIAPVRPDPPFQIASFDDIADDGGQHISWYDDRATGYMLQEVNEVHEGTGSMRIAFANYPGKNPSETRDISVQFGLVPALDFNDIYKNWAITVWVWRDPAGDSDVQEIILFDGKGNSGRHIVSPPATAGWQKITANVADFLWENDTSGVCIATDTIKNITAIELWASCSDWPDVNNSDIYWDDLRLEEAVEHLSEAKVYNADYAGNVTMTIDGNTADWEALVDSDVLDFDLAAVPEPNGNLHVKYRLAWDANFLYILVEEQPGDLVATEANLVGAQYGDWALNDQLGGDYYYDNLSLYFDFTNNHWPGTNVSISLWLYLGLNSKAATPLMMAWTNSDRTNEGKHRTPAVLNAASVTKGTLGHRITEAKLKWNDLVTGTSAINSWRLPEGGLLAAIKPGYIFGCDPRLNDYELQNALLVDPNDEINSAWLNGNVNGNPSGRDTYSTDVRLVYSAGDLDYDWDVDFADLQVLAENWLDDDCNNLNDFCNGADIVINGEVNFVDYAQLALRWLE